MMKTTIYTLCAIIVLTASCTNIRPRNTMEDCMDQCKDNKKTEACKEFCHCIHDKGEAFNECLNEFNSSNE